MNPEDFRINGDRDGDVTLNCPEENCFWWTGDWLLEDRTITVFLDAAQRHLDEEHGTSL